MTIQNVYCIIKPISKQMEECIELMRQHGLRPVHGVLLTEGKWRICEDPNHRYIAHLNEQNLICTFGSYKGGWKVLGTYNGLQSDRSISLKTQWSSYVNHEASSRRVLTHQKNRIEQAIEKQTQIWESLSVEPQCEDHLSYLRKKGVRGYGVRFGYINLGENQLKQPAIAFPIRDGNGNIQGIQYISFDGQKRIYGVKIGGFHLIGDTGSSGVIALCEGYATAASVFEAMEGKVVAAVCIDCGNLRPAGDTLCEKYPEHTFIVCGDNDQNANGRNPGKEHAISTARLIDAYWVVPTFKESSLIKSSDNRPSDFNDLVLLEGLEIARKQILAAITCEKLSTSTKNKELIFVVDGKVANPVAEKGRNLLSNPSNGVFQRDGQAVLIAKHINKKHLHNEKVLRKDGSLVIKSITEVQLVEKLNKICTWIKNDIKKDVSEKINFPKLAAQMILASPGEDIPYLTGIISAPTLRNDGSLLQEKGYDPSTGLYFSSEESFPLVAQHPTKDQALKALETLCEPIEEFSFAGEKEEELALNKSSAICMILSDIVRRSMAHVPIKVIDAPSMASGKTKLAKISSIISTGLDCTIITPTKDENELRKRVSSAMLAGDLCICLDNIDFPLESTFLCAAVTSTEISERELGKSRNNRILTNCSLYVTGNNVIIRGDLTSRTITCRLDPRTENPDERRFKRPELEKYVTENRGKYVVSALTIIRAYFAAGCPDQKIPPARDFVDFTRMIRSPLVWLGLPDPYLTTKAAKENDPEREILGNIFESWFFVYGSCEPIELNEVIKFVENKTIRGSDCKINGLYHALHEIAPVKGTEYIDIKALGIKLRDFKGKIINGYQLKAIDRYENGKKMRVAKWLVIRI